MPLYGHDVSTRRAASCINKYTKNIFHYTKNLFSRQYYSFFNKKNSAVNNNSSVMKGNSQSNLKIIPRFWKFLNYLIINFFGYYSKYK